MGDIIGALNKRRGRVMGMNPDHEGNQIVEAEVPMAEMTRYAIDLRSMTQGRGSFVFHFVRYEEAPPRLRRRPLPRPRPWRARSNQACKRDERGWTARRGNPAGGLLSVKVKVSLKIGPTR